MVFLWFYRGHGGPSRSSSLPWSPPSSIVSPPSPPPWRPMSRCAAPGSGRFRQGRRSSGAKGATWHRFCGKLVIFDGILSDFIGFYGDLMGFNAVFMGFHGNVRDFHGEKLWFHEISSDLNERNDDLVEFKRSKMMILWDLAKKNFHQEELQLTLIWLDLTNKKWCFSRFKQ